MSRSLGRLLGHLITALLFVGATWILYQELRSYHYQEISKYFKQIPRGRVFLSVFITIVSYLVLTGYDYLALRYVGRRLAYRKTAFASFVAYALSHNLGFSVLTGGAARYRFFSLWGLSAGEIARAVSFSAVAFWISFLSLCGVVLAVDPVPLPKQYWPYSMTLRPLGLALLIIPVGFAALSFYRRQQIRIKALEIVVPSPWLTARVIMLGATDWTVAAMVLYILLPPLSIPFLHFLGLFLVAQIIGVISHVPGGLGVFEAIMLTVVGATVPGSQLAGILLAYRMIYYIGPLLCSTVLFLLYEILSRSPLLAGVLRPVSAQVSSLAPRFLTLSVFIAGVVLLVSGAVPPLHGRYAWIASLLPLPVIEFSHFIGSVAGIGLLILARGLQQRLDFAWICSCILLGVGAVASLLKGFDYEEAAILGMMLLLLLANHSHFYRRTSIFKDAFEPEWLLAILSVLAATVGLVLFSYKHVEYARNLWWEVGFDSHAPRTLRAMLAVFATASVWGGLWLLRPYRPDPRRPDEGEIESAAEVIARFPKTFAALALVRDKTLLFNDKRDSFLMYGREGRSWVALGGPVGPIDARPNLIWEFLELCDLHHVWPAFYQAQPEDLPTYVDAGLHLIKLGQEGIVPLQNFTLEGQTVKSLRQTRNRMLREGYTVDVYPREQVPELIPTLRKISDEWLEAKSTREKGFSLGYFDDGYLSRFPCAVIKGAAGIIAFANVWTGAEKFELSVDLMRYANSAPSGAMDFLFIELMLWGKANGYHQFNLGMAPLAGFESHELAQLWNKVGNILFQHGEHFYNFQGVRAYKEKFHPVWEPRYIASHGGMRLPLILANIATLISGGVRGLVTK